LLSGQVQVQTIRLVEPIIEIEKFSDGRWNVLGLLGDNVEEKAAASPEPSSRETAVADKGTRSYDVRLDNFVIVDGTVIIRDGLAGTVEKIDNINAKVAAASLNGPFDSSGSLVARGFPLTYDISLGNIIEGRTVPITFSVGLAPEKGRLSASGVLTGLDENPTFKGTIAGESTRLSDLIHGFSGAGELPGLLGQNFAVQGEIAASAAGVDLSDLNINLGMASFAGSVRAEIGEKTSLAVDMATASINLDDWLALAAIPRPPSVNSTAQKKTEKTRSSNSTVSLSLPEKPIAEGGSGDFSLPTGIDVTLAINAESLTFRGGLMRQARASIDLANGEITISQLGAQFPGGADVAVFGFLSPVGGKPQFEGQIEVSISDLRSTLDWLGLSPPPVPSDRLRKVTLAGNLKATPQQLLARDIVLRFDSSRLTGAATVNLTRRPSFGVNLVLDRINLDAYLVADKPARKSPAEAAKSATTSGAKSTPPAAPVGGDNPIAQSLAGLKALQGFDANIKARIKTLVYGGTSIKDVVFDGSLSDATLDIKALSVAKMAGSSVSLDGVLANLSGIPSLKNIRIKGRVGDLGRLMRLAGSEPPPLAKSIGTLTLKTTLNGSVVKPKIKLELGGAGGVLSADGQLLLMPVIGGFDGKLDLRHKNLGALLRTLGVDYRPARKLGRLKLAANVKANISGLALNDLRLNTSPLSLQGSAAIAIDGARPKITANLTTREINVDNLLPVSGSARLNDGTRALPAAFVVPRAQNPASPFRHTVALRPGKWPTDIIDLSALKRFDADLKIKSNTVIFGKYRVENADIVATVNNGTLTVSRLNGGLFGGVFDGRATVNVARTLRVKSGIVLKNINVAKALLAVTGEQMATGSGELNLDMNTTGNSVAALIAGLNGQGALALRKLDVKTGGQGTAMSAALGLVAGLNNLGGSLLGNKRGGVAADITGTFAVSRGVARTNDLKLVSSMGNGRASGTVDLARWLIDVGGQVDLSQNFLGQILNQGAPTASTVPFSIRGRLDAPTVKLDTSSLITGALPLLGVDKLLRKKGLGSLLQNILPGLGGTGQSRQPPPPGDQPPPPPPA
ncbi:MAG TPA: AsmA family protein, partial [Rhodospirillales bacterium]|nr:AsmA family protein [Rhodospirillales bacterium]